MEEKVCIFWFRRDLRLDDNAGLFRALMSGDKVLPVFIFDTEILDAIEEKYDRRVDFIYQAVENLNVQLLEKGSSLHVYNGRPITTFNHLLSKYNITKIVFNRDYEPAAQKRDKEIQDWCSANGIVCESYKDQCIFESEEILKENNTPYTVFTPYSKKWKQNINNKIVSAFPNHFFFNNFAPFKAQSIPALNEIGFQKTDIVFNKPKININLIQQYHFNRDFPAINRTSKLSVHLRFGTISIREAVRIALVHNDVWLNELIWRDFYMMILSKFPHVTQSSFKREYDLIEWRNNEHEFEKWCRGETGFPLVDAGIRELNSTGFMHNRVRMVTASFLVKHLLIDWKWGEAYFAQKLNDYDLSANNGGWQWAAGSGCDAAPYFRIFNPELQQKKFDPVFSYIKKWIPEFGTENYSPPIVDHALARERALQAYKKALVTKPLVNNHKRMVSSYTY